MCVDTKGKTEELLGKAPNGQVFILDPFQSIKKKTLIWDLRNLDNPGVGPRHSLDNETNLQQLVYSAGEHQQNSWTSKISKY